MTSGFKILTLLHHPWLSPVRAPGTARVKLPGSFAGTELGSFAALNLSVLPDASKQRF